MYNILVVDDDKEIVKAIEIYLSKEGYKILKAYNGKDALEVIKTNTVHLGILDIMMPKMDGITLAKTIRKSYTFPLIMLSAKSEDYDKIEGLNCGADDYVTKPFNPLELIARVNSCIRRYTSLRSNRRRKQESISNRRPKNKRRHKTSNSRRQRNKTNSNRIQHFKILKPK